MLRILSEKKLRLFYEKQIGSEFTVLFESENKNGFIQGFTENYLKIKFPFREDWCNNLKKITIKGFEQDGNLEAVFNESAVPAL